MSGGQNVSKTGGTNKVSEKKVFSTRSNHISLGRNNKRKKKRIKKKGKRKTTLVKGVTGMVVGEF